MARVVIDESMRAKLKGLQEQTEFCDESGQSLGCCLPEEAYWRLQLAADGCPYTYEEVLQFRQETDGRPLADIRKSRGRN